MLSPEIPPPERAGIYMTYYRGIKQGRKRMKKLIRMIMAMVMVLTMVSVVSVSVQAEKPVVTIYDFSADTKLNYDHYNTLRTGKMNVIYEKGAYWYTFETDQMLIKVPVTVFSNTDAANDKSEFDRINQTLSRSVLKGTGDADGKSRLIYKRSAGVETVRYRDYEYKKYNIYICNLEINSHKKTNQTFKVSCNMFGQILFTYSTLVNSYMSREKAILVQPSNRATYLRALKRDNSDDVSETVTPQFTVNISQPGSANVYLNSYSVMGRGTDRKDRKDAREFVNDLKNYKKVYESVSKMVLNPGVRTVVDVVSSVAGLQKTDDKKSTLYNTGECNPLSSKGKYTLQATFEAPLPLNTYKDFTQYLIDLSDIPTSSGYNRIETVMTVEFTVK